MSILNQITSARVPTGQRIVIAGVEKIGKTTLACGAPRALLIPLEMGYATVNVSRAPMIESMLQLNQLLSEITVAAQSGQFPYQTLVFDSATALERLLHDAVLRTDSSYAKKNANALTMESALGGYGKAYQFANELFSRFLHQCDMLAIYGRINIVLTCHVFASDVVDPVVGNYSSWDLLLHSPKNNKTHGKREILTQWADMIGFLHEPLYIVAGGDTNKMTRAISMNKGRLLGVDRTPSYVAGNRYGLTSEIAIPAANGWNYVADAVFKQSGIDLYNRD
jgi:hypothetical protein